MQIISTNIAEPTTFIWNGKKHTTGIYKKPVDQSIFLGNQSVQNDEISDRNVHGGEFKACYLFSAEQYNYWKDLYPNLDWEWGMFGENLTVTGLNEKSIHVGNIYKLGTALVQISQPREPCYKFGYKFGTQQVLEQFIDRGYAGTYVRVLEEGFVKKGDYLVLVEKAKDSISTWQLFNLLNSKNKDQDLIQLILNNNALPKRKRENLRRFII